MSRKAIKTGPKTGPETRPKVQIRTDLLRAEEDAWHNIASPGNWWTGAQRVAIARAARGAWDCALCTHRKAALSPNATGPDGTAIHNDTEALTEIGSETVDVVHRLVRDQHRLSREWLDALVEEGVLTKLQYVELVGVVSRAVSLDVFNFALGAEPFPLPDPRAGEPTRYVPPGLAMEQAWVPMILTENLGPDEQDLYGATGNVIRAMSAVPEEVRQLKKLSAHQYMAIEDMRDFVGGQRVGRSIDRAQAELIAARVSALHECFY